MNYTEALTRYTANFIDELTDHGLRHVVISPGSRSTPLAVLCAEHERIKDWIVVDERSAAYFALGMAQATQTPVALVCTSGTAAANYLPAVVEAYYARVPLLILTADRPHELRDIGASQTINQIGMYHHFVKQFYEMAAPSSSPEMLGYVRNRALRAMKIAMENNPGPVHVNFPFREPLMPDIRLEDLWGRKERGHFSLLFSSKKQLARADLNSLREFMLSNPNGLFVCGPQTDLALQKEINELSKFLQVPVLVDPLSQLRTGMKNHEQIITTYDTFFRSAAIRKKLKPDYIIRFGAMPVSKHYSFYLAEHRDVTQFVVENNDTVREPTNHDSHYIIADAARLCRDLRSELDLEEKEAEPWLASWKKLDREVSLSLQAVTHPKLTEGIAIRKVIEQLPTGSHLFVANSMPIRDVDTFLLQTEKRITVYANRGVSGIDGTLSTALGVAATGKPVTLIIGDLSFYHDLNSLLIAKRYELPIKIVLINNNGGGIFSFLPQAEEDKYFEHLFGTPLDIDFKHAVDMYGGDYKLVEDENELELALKMDKQAFSVVEIQTDRQENVSWHRKIWNDIIKRLEQDDEI